MLNVDGTKVTINGTGEELLLDLGAVVATIAKAMKEKGFPKDLATSTISVVFELAIDHVYEEKENK